jgi:hypothetical protein
MTIALDSPVVSPSLLRSVNFFNGRLLTGDDLRGEQAAQEARLRRLGRLCGEGVASGLEVTETRLRSTPQRPVVTVAAGLALSRSGPALELPVAVDLLLARPAPTATSEPGGLFADCQPFAPGTYTAGAGVYLLTIGPARQGEGLAPVSGLGNRPAACNVASSVESVRFRLIRLALDPSELTDVAHLRNRVAYRCFAPEALASFSAEPFGVPPARYGLIDALREQTLTADEVPLAVLAWSALDGIGFIDLWAVRRRIIRSASEGGLTAFTGDRRRAEGEAMFLQFQDHVADLRSAPGAANLHAADAFRTLPPAGLLPLRRTSSLPGFDLTAFFTGIPRRADPVILEGARVEHALTAALAYPPIDPQSGEALRLYLVRENQLAAASPPYVLFTSGHAPYEADARFDLAFWNFANYAEA